MNETLKLLAKEMRANSERWFPHLHDGSRDLSVFYALGLAGECSGSKGSCSGSIRASATNESKLARGASGERTNVTGDPVFDLDSPAPKEKVMMGDEIYVNEGWWHPNVKSGQVHDHPERPGGSWSAASHRLCEPVFTRRPGRPESSCEFDHPHADHPCGSRVQ